MRTERRRWQALRGAESLWPVRTGASKDGWGYMKRGEDVQYTNRENYAAFVEARTRAATRTLNRREDSLERRTDQAVGSGLRGILGRFGLG